MINKFLDYNTKLIKENSGKRIGPIEKMMAFQMRYPHDFIERVWIDDPRMIKHLKEKFSGLYKSCGSTGIINVFYHELSKSHQMKLIQWILDNYEEFY